MAKHTDFGRLRGAAQPSPRRGGPRTALFTDGQATRLDETEARTPADVRTPSREAEAAPSESTAAASVTSGGTAGAGAASAGAASGPGFELACSACGSRTRVGLLGLLIATTPSIHLPLIKRDYPSFMRCPRCRVHRWVSVTFTLSS